MSTYFQWSGRTRAVILTMLSTPVVARYRGNEYGADERKKVVDREPSFGSSRQKGELVKKQN